MMLVAAVLGAGAALVMQERRRAQRETEQPEELGPTRQLSFPSERQRLGAEPVGTQGAPVSKELTAHIQGNNLAVQLIQEGDLAGAVELLEKIHSSDPSQETYAHNLAEALVRLGREEYELGDAEAREGAPARLERAFELNPARTELPPVSERWREALAAEASFWTEVSEHFELSYDGDRSELLQESHKLQQTLEEAYQDFGELFGTFPVEEGRPRFRVVLYRREEFGQVTGLGDWAGGAFDGVVRVPVEGLREEEQALTRVLRHELTHAFVREVGGERVPGWLNEGLAQYLEPRFLLERQQEATAALGRVGGEAFFPLSELQSTLASWRDAEAIGRAYAQSQAFVGYLARTFGERVLFEMVAACGASSTPEVAFKQRTAQDLQRVLQDLDASR